MSNYVQGLVYKFAPYDDDRFKVLCALADWADDDGGGLNPSLIKLARKARVGYRNTIKVLQKLEADPVKNGEKMLRIVRHKKKGMANNYYINVLLLESLPFYWPKPLLEYVEKKSRVNSVHPSQEEAAVEKRPRKGERGGKNRVNSRVNSRGEPSSPHEVMSHDVMNHDQYDYNVSQSHDETIKETVENLPGYTPSLFTDLEAQSALVKFSGARAVPIGARWVRDETDPGGYSTGEVEAALRSMLGRELNHWDLRDLAKINGFNFSTQLTIYLFEQIKHKAREMPGTGKFYRLSLERLDRDCGHSIRELKIYAVEQNLSREARFWLLNEEVLREIARWEHFLGRS